MPERNFSLARLAAAAVIAAFLVCAAAVAWLARDLPGDASEPRRLDTSDPKFVMGSGQADGERLIIDGFTDGYALLSSGPVNLNANEFRFLSLALDRLAEGEAPSFFWRRSEAPADLAQLRLRESGELLIDLSRRTDWHGDVSELGFLFHDDGGPPVALGPATLEPDRLALRLQLAWDSWTYFEDWSQKSINFLNGGTSDQPVRLPLLVMAWITLTLALATLLARLSGQPGSREFLAGGAVIFLVAWMVLDLRWTVNSALQFKQTTETYRGVDEAEKLRRGLDGQIYSFIERLKREVLPKNPARILIVGDEQTAEYLLQRAKYHLLPHSANAARQIASSVSPDALDYIVFFGEADLVAGVPGWDAGWQDAAHLIDQSKSGSIYRLVGHNHE